MTYKILFCLFGLLILPSVSAVWEVDNDINASLPDVGSFEHPTIFLYDGTLYSIWGRNDGTMWGFNYTGTVWQPDYGINASLPDVGSRSTPYVFFLNGNLHMLVADATNDFVWGFNYTGTVWQPDYGINASLPTPLQSPAVFLFEGTLYLIDEVSNQAFNYTGTVWQPDYGINASLTQVIADPHVFFKDGTLYLIGLGGGFNYTGTVWQPDGNINGSINNIFNGFNPFIFFFENNIYSFLGQSGFKWNESTTPTVTINSPSGTTTNTSIILNATSTDSDSSFYWYNDTDFIISSDTPINKTGLVGWWNLGAGNGNSWISNENVSDLSGNSNDGEIFGAEYVQKGMEFDGSASYVLIDDSDGDFRFDNGAHDFAISMWVRHEAAATGYVLDHRDGSVDGWRFLISSTGQANFGLDAINVVSIVGAVTQNNWHHVVVSINRSGNGQVYIDGIASGAAVAIGGEVMASTVDLYMGRRSDTAANYYNGKVDKVRIYNRSLSATEILEEYNLANGYYNWTHSDIETSITFTCNASDSYTNATATVASGVDYTTVLLYDEIAGTLLTDLLPIRFQNGTSFQIIQTIEGVNATFKNIDALIGQKVRIEAKNTSHPNYPHPRSVVDGSYTAGEDFNIYLPSATETVVAPSFVITDVTGDFNPQDTTLRIKRFIGINLITIFEDFFDLERDASAFLITDEHYTVEVESIAGEVRDLGAFVPESAADVPIFVGPVKYAPGNNINDLIEWNVTTGSVISSFRDTSELTTQIIVSYYNGSNTSQRLDFNVVDAYWVAFSYDPPENMTVLVEINYTRDGSNYSLYKSFNFYDGPRKVDLGLLEEWHYTLISFIIIITAIMIFNDFNAGIGAIFGVGTVGLLRFLGWITVPVGTMGLLIFFAFIAFILSQRGRR